MKKNDIALDIDALMDSKDARAANLCTGTREDGSQFYVYILQTYRQMDTMQRVMRLGASVDFSEYGEIVAYGEGAMPPEDVKTDVEKKHGFDHNFEKKLISEFKELSDEYQRMKKHGVSEADFLKQKLNALGKDLAAAEADEKK